MLKRLKAPWSFSKQNGIPGHCIVAQIWDKDGKALAQIKPHVRQDIVNEQVKIMAAAPELLEALLIMCQDNGYDLTQPIEGFSHRTQIVINAIKKATE